MVDGLKTGHTGKRNVPRQFYATIVNVLTFFTLKSSSIKSKRLARNKKIFPIFKSEKNSDELKLSANPSNLPINTHIYFFE